MTQIINTTVTHDETHLLFDSSYWDNQEVFENIQLYQLGDPETMFGGSKTLSGNEKYIRDYTIFGFKDYSWYKTGGLVVDGDTCGYKAGYIKPDDVFYYKDTETDTEVKSINFNELIVCAIHHCPDGSVASMYFAIFFRSIRTGEFYVIRYNYSLIYEANFHPDKQYLNYYAHKADLTEEELFEASAKYDIVLYNTTLYKAKSRNHKISVVTSCE